MVRQVSVAAVDLGASSGRVMLGRVGPGVLALEQVARFANEPVLLPDGLHWDAAGLHRSVVEGLCAAAAREPDLTGVGIDSWGVDYGLLCDGRLLGQPFHYRDEGRAVGVERVHAVVPHAELYARNGLQLLPFTTLYQLAAEPLLARADRLLLMPDLMAFLLTGVEATERTNASTTGLLDPATGEWDDALIERLGYPRRVFADLVAPGDAIGGLRREVASVLGVGVLPVTAVGSHDTASAVAAVPFGDDESAYVSLGTWGLVGLELEAPVVSEQARLAGFTHEGGVGGRVRFLTNVMGTWMLSECLREWERRGTRHDLGALLAAAADVSTEPPLVDVQDPRFAAPGDMPTRIAGWYAERGTAAPSDPVVVTRCLVESMAQAYAEALDRACGLTGRTVRTVHVVGGGAQNRLLCASLARRSGRRVLAGPVEATALGNVLVQGMAAGALPDDLGAARRLVAATHEPAAFTPSGAGPLGGRLGP